MNQESIDLISQLASKLNTSVEILIGWFAVRAPYEFVAVGISILFIAAAILIGFLAIYYQKKAETEKDFERETNLRIGAVAILIVGFVMGLIGLMFFTDHLFQSVMAVASPEAYAIEEILKAIR